MRRFAALAVMAALAGCATSSHVLTGTPRAPIDPASVRIYTLPPPQYEQIAALSATSGGSLAITSQQNMDKAIERLKREAARLGANGVLLQSMQDRQSASIGGGGGSTSYGGGSAVGAGGGLSVGLYSKEVTGLAIYVPE
ncbi:MAG TPA: hypothetical protein VKQ31_01760 [Steroidobacteraceae bacterium]|nr:hypothetical protein [Steroidobacteraceae bacterium]